MRIPDPVLPQVLPGHSRGGRTEPVQAAPRVAKDKRDDPHRRRDYDDGPALDLLPAQEPAQKVGEEHKPPAETAAPSGERSGEASEEGPDPGGGAAVGHVIDRSA